MLKGHCTVSRIPSVIGVVVCASNASSWDPEAGAHKSEASQGCRARICETKKQNITTTTNNNNFSEAKRTRETVERELFPKPITEHWFWTLTFRWQSADFFPSSKVESISLQRKYDDCTLSKNVQKAFQKLHAIIRQGQLVPKPSSAYGPWEQRQRVADLLHHTRAVPSGGCSGLRLAFWVPSHNQGVSLSRKARDPMQIAEQLGCGFESSLWPFLVSGTMPFF